MGRVGNDMSNDFRNGKVFFMTRLSSQEFLSGFNNKDIGFMEIDDLAENNNGEIT